jgi:type I restriction enzyme S subunit
LLREFGRLIESRDAVPRVRSLVLHLAVRGRLGTSDPHDEPLSAYLPKLEAREGSFAVPSGWAWHEVGRLGHARLGKMLDRAKNRGDARPYLRNVNVRWFDFDLSDLLEMRFEPSELEELELRTGDVLICEGGEPGRAAVWDERASGVYFQKAVHRVRFSPAVDPHYFTLALRASADDGRLARYFTGVAIKHFTGRSLDKYLVPLPPPAEQRRIVAKVDALMALCDQLGAALSHRATVRAQATSAALMNLSGERQAGGNAQATLLARVRSFTESRDQTAEWRRCLLSLAVRGRLVRQNPNDQSASELLAAIAGEKAKQVALRAIPRSTALPPLAPSEYPFSLPAGWAWTRLGELCHRVADGPHHSPGYVSAEHGVPFLSTRNVRLGTFDLSSVKYVSQADHEEFSKKIRPERGDILYTKGGTTGIAKVNDLPFEFSVWVHVAVLRIDKTRLEPRYIELALNSPHCYAQSQNYTQGISNFDLGLTRLVKITVPLPPLAEQRRIVARVDELMALCDQLESALTARDEARSRLLDALIAEALAS